MEFGSFSALTLARIQFAANISFHILFPAITIALAWILLFFRWRYRATRDEAWEKIYNFWTNIFALSFALGVVSGVTMSFQFGTNWPGFMQTAGNIAGPLLGYEILSAFFLEATFLGIMLFGRNYVSERTHLIAIFLVAFGTTLSAFWILSLNSWMQTPVGYTVINGVFHAQDWWRIIFNPSFPYRFIHMLLASFLTCAFLLAGISAWQMLKGIGGTASEKALRTGVVLAAVITPIQIGIGDLLGLNSLQHQPAKIAAIEALWQTQRGAPLVLFALPDAETKSNQYAIEIPKGSSLILKHDANAEVQGLNEFANAHPPVAPVFFAFRIMVGIGVLMLITSWLAVWYLCRKRAVPKSVLWLIAGMTFSGWIATLAGWYVTEIGRQPWLIHNLVKTADMVAPHTAGTVMTTLAGYLVLYLFLIASYIGVLNYLARTFDERK